MQFLARWFAALAADLDQAATEPRSHTVLP
jgi:hypothetical protein